MKRIISLFLTAVIFIGAFPCTSMAESDFTDLTGYEWAEEYIKDLADKGVINGVAPGYFAPGDTLTREQFAKIIVEAFGYSAENASSEFTDVDKDQWYYPYVSAISAEGIVNGIGNDMFGVGLSVSLQDMMLIVYRILTGSVEAENTYEAFAALADPYAAGAVGYLAGLQIYPDTEALGISYKEPAKRAHAAKVVSQAVAYQSTGEAPVIEPGTETTPTLVEGEPRWADFKLGAPDYEWHMLDYQGDTDISPEDMLDARMREAGDEIPVFDPVEVKGETKIFVATDGNDQAGNGSIDKPYKTLKKAAAQVEALSTDTKDKGVIIYLRGGEYSVPESEQAIFNEISSGTENAPLFIAAYNNEHVTITTAKVLNADAFIRVSDMNILSALPSEAAQDNLYVATFEDLGVTEDDIHLNGGQFPTLYMNGTQMQISRYPNDSRWSMNNIQIIQTGMLGADKSNDTDYQTSMKNRGGIDVEEGLPKFKETDERALSWKYSNDIWIQGCLYADYFDRKYSVRDITDGVVTITVPLSNFNRIANLRKNAGSYHYCNVVEETDIPGEFTVDSENELVYLYPIGDLNGAEMILRPAGKYSKYNIENALAAPSYSPITLKNASNIVIDGIEFSTCTRVMDIDYSIYCVIQNCKFTNNSATVIHKNASSVAIVNNVFENNGAIEYGGDNSQTRRKNMAKCILQNNVFASSSVTNAGNYHGNILSHNVVVNSSAGSFNGWYSDFIMEYNEFCASPGTLEDGGTMYDGGGVEPNMGLSRFNYIHETSGAGIYFDDWGHMGLAYGNITRNTDRSGIYLHNASYCAVKNNIGAGGSNMQMSPNYYNGYLEGLSNKDIPETEPVKTEYSELEKNRYPFVDIRATQYYNQRMLMYTMKDAYTKEDDIWRAEIYTPTRNSWVNNFIFGGEFVNTTFGKYEPEDVRGNVLSTVEPGFTDIENGDFTFVENAPILQVEGFEGMDKKFNRIGLTIDFPAEKLETKPKNLAPLNGETVDAGKCRFYYKPSPFAVYHDFELALDPNFKNVLHKERVRTDMGNPSVEVNIGYADMEFYWRVTPVYLDATVNLPEESSDAFKLVTK